VSRFKKRGVSATTRSPKSHTLGDLISEELKKKIKNVAKENEADKKSQRKAIQNKSGTQKDL